MGRIGIRRMGLTHTQQSPKRLRSMHTILYAVLRFLSLSPSPSYLQIKPYLLCLNDSWLIRLHYLNLVLVYYGDTNIMCECVCVSVLCACARA